MPLAKPSIWLLRLSVFCVSLLFSLFRVPPLDAAVPSTFTYQGSLKQNGSPVTGTYSMEFRITNSTGALYWTSGALNITITDGLYRVPLAPGTAIDWVTSDPYMEIKLGGTTLLPREKLTSSVYALMASTAKDLSDGTVRAKDGSASAPGISFFNDTDTGFHRPSANSITTTVGGSTAAIVSSAGEITQPLQPSFLVYLSANQNNVTGDTTVYTIPFDTEDFDQGFDIALTTFTAPVSGKYELHASVMAGQLPSEANTYIQVRIVTSNRWYESRVQNIPAMVTELTRDVSVIADMDANDTATVVVEVGGGSKVVDVFGTLPMYTRFSGSLIN